MTAPTRHPCICCEAMTELPGLCADCAQFPKLRHVFGERDAKLAGFDPALAFADTGEGEPGC